MTKKLYNVTVRVVDLVWASDEEEARQILFDEIAMQTSVEILPEEPGDTFISEPCTWLGWDGEKRVDPS